MKRNITITLAILFSSTVYAANNHAFDPPWNTPPASAVEFTVPGIDNVPDLYGDVENPQLTIFFAGNQFMVIDELLAGFKQKYPQYTRVFAETLPPGILAKQIEGGSLTLGNLRLTHKPDVYTAGKTRITQMESHFSRTVPYAKNKLTLMVTAGNPKGVAGLKDLSREDLRISMPNPTWEGVGRQIETAYVKAGGNELHDAVMKTKVDNQSTFLTKIHHRESPMRVLYGESDVAPVWSTEVTYQKMKGHPIDEIKIPIQENIEATYIAGELKNAPHPAAAKDFMDFIGSPESKRIYAKYGFIVD